MKAALRFCHEKISELLKKPLFAGIAGLVIGLIIGLPILGWLVWPVQWYDAEPVHLSAYWQEKYLCAVMESYGRTGDAAEAQIRFKGLGAKGTQVLANMEQTCGKMILPCFKILKPQLEAQLPRFRRQAGLFFQHRRQKQNQNDR